MIISWHSVCILYVQITEKCGNNCSVASLQTWANVKSVAVSYLFTTWLRKELSSAKITLPDFSFKLRIGQGRKLKHIKAENICSEKICLLFACLLSLSAVLTAAVSRIRSINGCTNRLESSCTKFVFLKQWRQQNPLLVLKIQASNDIIWFEIH